MVTSITSITFGFLTLSGGIEMWHEKLMDIPMAYICILSCIMLKNGQTYFKKGLTQNTKPIFWSLISGKSKILLYPSDNISLCLIPIWVDKMINQFNMALLAKESFALPGIFLAITSK